MTAICTCSQPVLMPSGHCYECEAAIHIEDQARATPVADYLIGKAFENGHNCPNCIDRDIPRYCAGLYWPLWNLHKEEVTEEMIREGPWPDFPGWPAWGHLDLISGGEKPE